MSGSSSSCEADGIFRRRIRLVQANQQTVVAGLEDDFHAFKITLNHDGQHVISMVGEAVRYPLDACPGATGLLPQLTGIPLSPDCRSIGAFTEAKQHCTHLFDLAGLAVAHAYRGESVRQYDIQIPDPQSDESELFLLRDGKQVLHMVLSGDTVVHPAPYTGLSIEGGFSSWLQQHITDLEEREAALVLQRGRFVSVGRQYKALIQKSKKAWRNVPVGVCYSHQAERIEQTLRMEDSIRDFSDDGSELVNFVD